MSFRVRIIQRYRTSLTSWPLCSWTHTWDINHVSRPLWHPKSPATQLFVQYLQVNNKENIKSPLFFSFFLGGGGGVYCSPMGQDSESVSMSLRHCVCVCVEGDFLCTGLFNWDEFHQTCNISYTKSQNVNVSRFVLQLPLPTPSEPGVWYSWGSADWRCSNYIWLINNFDWRAAYIRGLRVGWLHHNTI